MKQNINQLLNTENALVKLGECKLPFNFQIQKNLSRIRKITKEFFETEKLLKDSYYEKDNGQPIKYVGEKINNRLEPKRDSVGNPIVSTGKLLADEFEILLIPDDRIDDFKKEYQKLLDEEHDITFHQILESEIEAAIKIRFDKTGESPELSIIENLVDTVIVNEIRNDS